MGARLEPELAAALRKAWHGTTADGTGLADRPFGDAIERAELVYDVICLFYDEAKFRTIGPAVERELLAKVGDAARGYADRLFVMSSTSGEDLDAD
ncbi:hypothetical protein [Streptomyces sp. NBC_01304]|uniref:hypothetical protein n=1 Tax=Streptomyces sp. NBC_01304 TaxID=2903818 RepID=UPI002E155A81|nr:hypothetical protein OG430_48835 [Streptomyces sp. NBC_01304]